MHVKNRKGRGKLREQSRGDWIKKQTQALLNSRVILQSNVIRTINRVPTLQTNPVISVSSVKIFLRSWYACMLHARPI